MDSDAPLWADTADGFLRGFVFDTHPEDIPPGVRDQAALLLLDTLGVCAAATNMDAARIARDTAVALYGAGGDQTTARLLFDGRGTSIAGAAFAAATQTDNLDAHDGYNPTKGHIGVATVPVLAVLGQSMPDLTGPQALAALVIGYEVAGRAGLALHATVADYHTSGAWNALGVAAMASRLRGSDPGRLRHALGIAEYHGPRSQMMREIANPTMLHDGSGMGAMIGVSAAVMAEAGFDGAPAITVQADEVAAYWADLGRHWQTTDQYIKPYPICRWAHAAIDAAAALRQKHALDHRAIDRINVRSFNNAVALFPEMPATTSQAQYSLPFAVATMLVHGEVGVANVSGAGLCDADVAHLVTRTEMRAEPRHETRFPDGRWADVEIEMADGRLLSSGDFNARGGPEDPLSQNEVLAKFHRFADPVLGRDRAQRIAQAALDLPDASSGFAALSDLLVDAP